MLFPRACTKPGSIERSWKNGSNDTIGRSPTVRSETQKQFKCFFSSHLNPRSILIQSIGLIQKLRYAVTHSHDAVWCVLVSNETNHVPMREVLKALHQPAWSEKPFAKGAPRIGHHKYARSDAIGCSPFNKKRNPWFSMPYSKLWCFPWESSITSETCPWMFQIALSQS